MMNKIFCFIILLFTSITIAHEQRKLLGRRTHFPKEWNYVGKASNHDSVKFTIYLKQENLPELEKFFWEVSNPKSDIYRQFLTQDQLDNFVKASDEGKRTVKAWLAEFEHCEIVRETADTFVVQTHVGEAKQMFLVDFDWFAHKDYRNHNKLVFTGELTLPVSVSKYVDFVGGISELWKKPRKPKNKLHSQRRLTVDDILAVQDDNDVIVTPFQIQDYYNIPFFEKNTNETNLQMVAAFSDYFSKGAYEEFWTQLMQQPAPKVTEVGQRCLDNDEPCDQDESDLDIQYITAIGNGVPTLFHNTANESIWLLQFTEDTLLMDPLPYVISVSYGFAELLQCLIDEICETLGIETDEYVDRVNTNFQKLAVRGASVFVSDGDDGVAGVLPNGEDPIDAEFFCPSDYVCSLNEDFPCENPGPCKQDTSKCMQFVIRNKTTGDECNYPVGQAAWCDWLVTNDAWSDEALYAQLQEANRARCELELYRDGSMNIHMFSSCDCRALSIDWMDLEIVPLVFDENELLYFADFPTASAYVTSVGATQFISDDGQTVNGEVGASIKTGAIITTGGGFSVLLDAPVYQSVAVSTWESFGGANKPPSATYDTAYRGFPDVTLVGHNYAVFFSTNEDDLDICPCDATVVDGTSASAPALAGMVSLVNGNLLNEGKPPLGFLNPLWYQMWEEDSSLLNDIVLGDNKCTRSYCLEYGFQAARGWDPVAGLGSVDYTKFKTYVMENL